MLTDTSELSGRDRRHIGEGKAGLQTDVSKREHTCTLLRQSRQSKSELQGVPEVQHQGRETEAAKWNSAIIHFIIYTCAFPTVTSQKCQVTSLSTSSYLLLKRSLHQLISQLQLFC